MIRRFGIFVQAMLAVLLLGGAALAQTAPSPPPVRGFTVQNETDQTLFTLFAFPPNAQDRGPDRLGTNVVEPGNSYRVTVGRTANCTFDIVVTFADGTEDVRRAVNICRNQRQVYGDPATPRLEVSVRNGADLVLRELYIAAAGSEGWGPDRLGSTVIEPGTSFDVRLRTRDCAFRLRAVWADDREEVREADLCAARSQVFDRSSLPRPERRTVRLENQHLALIQEFYVSGSQEADWGPDRLGASTLPIGQSLDLDIETACDVDVRVVFPNGGAEERREINICEAPTLTITPGWVVGGAATPGAAPTPGATAAPPRAAGRVLRNAGALPIVELYAAPAGQPRGADRLGAAILPAGGTFTLPTPAPDACRQDLVAVFRDGREAALPGVDLCQGEELEIP